MEMHSEDEDTQQPILERRFATTVEEETTNVFPINGKLYTGQQIMQAMQLFDQFKTFSSQAKQCTEPSRLANCCESVPTGNESTANDATLLENGGNGNNIVVSVDVLKTLVDTLVTQKMTEAKGKPQSASGPAQNIRIIRSVRDLSSLGRFQKLDVTRGKFKSISQYVENSHGVLVGQVKVHDVYTHKNVTTVNGAAGSSKKQQPALLLWFKTSTESIQKLGKQKNSPMAFYDRVGRAFAVAPQDIKQPLRQILLLFAVSLGNIHKGAHGYGYWSKRSPTKGHDSEKGIGKLVPNWEECINDGQILIPCGKSETNTKYSSYELDYNEYIIWEAKRAKLLYAVDIEITPGTTVQE